MIVFGLVEFYFLQQEKETIVSHRDQLGKLTKNIKGVTTEAVGEKAIGFFCKEIKLKCQETNIRT